jgi:hypothetical protein
VTIHPQKVTKIDIQFENGDVMAMDLENPATLIANWTMTRRKGTGWDLLSGVTMFELRWSISDSHGDQVAIGATPEDVEPQFSRAHGQMECNEHRCNPGQCFHLHHPVGDSDA